MLLGNLERLFGFFRGSLWLSGSPLRVWGRQRGMSGGTGGVGETLEWLGVGRLNDGLSRLKDGLGQPKDGLTQLKDGLAQLKDGVSQLKDGLI